MPPTNDALVPVTLNIYSLSNREVFVYGLIAAAALATAGVVSAYMEQRFIEKYAIIPK